MMPFYGRQDPESTSTQYGDSNLLQPWPQTSAPVPRRSTMQRPITIHEGSFPMDFASELERSGLTSWNDFTVPESTHYSYHAPDSMHAINVTDFGGSSADSHAFPDLPVVGDSNQTMTSSKPSEEHLDFSQFDSDLTRFTNDINSTDENALIINLGKEPATLDEPLSLDNNYSRRYSGSSFVSSTGGPSDIPDISTYSEVPSYASDYTPRSSLNLSVTPLSPVVSPRYPNHQHEAIRTGSRSRASPSPRPSMRAAPYSLEGARNKRWSTGSYGPSPSRRSSPYMFTTRDGQNNSALSALSRIDSPVAPAPNHFLSSNSLSNISLHNSAFQSPPRFHRPTAILPSNFDAAALSSNNMNLGSTPVLPSNHNNLVRTLASNVDPYLHHHLDQYACLSDPPDLFGSLSEEPIAPPEEDMNPSDLELVPHEQELRFENDLYTPRWVRGHGNKREGWCGICKPGRWLVLKNSAFWYDKSFTHGVSAATGQAFDGPKETRRMEGNADVWEGLCGGCGEWIALVSSKKKGTTWFRHAYKVSLGTLLLTSKAHNLCSATLIQRSRTFPRGGGKATIVGQMCHPPTPPKQRPNQSHLKCHLRYPISSHSGQVQKLFLIWKVSHQLSDCLVGSHNFTVLFSFSFDIQALLLQGGLDSAIYIRWEGFSGTSITGTN